MLIQLRQNEIEEALHEYISKTVGINLTGKTIEYTFTAGRGNAGTTVDLNIVNTPVLQEECKGPEPRLVIAATADEIAQAYLAGTAGHTGVELQAVSEAVEQTAEEAPVPDAVEEEVLVSGTKAEASASLFG